jgi:hypothetical protein
MDQQPDVIGFYDAPTGSIQYIVTDLNTRTCAVVDPVLDYDPRSGSTRTTSADGLLRYIEAHELTLEWILDSLQVFLDYIGKCEGEDDGQYASAGDLLAAVRTAAEAARMLASQ